MLNLPRADHVGSLLRPQALKRAHQAHAAKELNDGELAQAVEACISEAVRRQEDVGLQVVTDGEFRRGSWFLGFVEAVDGIELKQVDLQFGVDSAKTTSWFGPTIARKLTRKRPIVADDYSSLAKLTSRIAKVTMPTPSALHFFGGKDAVSRSAYPDLQAFTADIARVYHDELSELYAVGCRYVQLDEVPLALLCDESIRASLSSRGEDPERLTDLYIEMINAAMAGRPRDLVVSLHLCRGNYKGKWMGSGGYDRIAERLFNAVDVDAYLLEYDSERAGSFEALRHLPNGKRAYLGVVSSKTGEVESLDLLRHRMDEAFSFTDPERLGVCPQCGFASSVGGNPLTEEQQWAKLQCVVELALRTWNTH